MVMRPLLRYAAAYAAVELAAVVLLIWAFGIGWTMVVLAATFLVGMVVAASQWKGQIGAMRRARANPQGLLADGVLVGAGSFLVFLPGVVSTAAGVLMLAPPTRSAMRPLASALIGRGMLRGVDAVNLGQFTRRGERIGGEYIDYIDGEVIAEPVVRPSRAAIARRTSL